MGGASEQGGLPGQSDFIQYPEGRGVRKEARGVSQNEGILNGSLRGKKGEPLENQELIAAAREHCSRSSNVIQQRGASWEQWCHQNGPQKGCCEFVS